MRRSASGVGKCGRNSKSPLRCAKHPGDICKRTASLYMTPPDECPPHCHAPSAKAKPLADPICHLMFEIDTIVPISVPVDCTVPVVYRTYLRDPPIESYGTQPQKRLAHSPYVYKTRSRHVRFVTCMTYTLESGLTLDKTKSKSSHRSNITCALHVRIQPWAPVHPSWRASDAASHGLQHAVRAEIPSVHLVGIGIHTQALPAEPLCPGASR